MRELEARQVLSVAKVSTLPSVYSRRSWALSAGSVVPCCCPGGASGGCGRPTGSEEGGDGVRAAMDLRGEVVDLVGDVFAEIHPAGGEDLVADGCPIKVELVGAEDGVGDAGGGAGLNAAAIPEGWIYEERGGAIIEDGDPVGGLSSAGARVVELPGEHRIRGVNAKGLGEGVGLERERAGAGGG